MRSVIKKEKETARIIHNMAKLFRSSLTWNRDKVTVKEETEFILCFLEIQKYRFAERLHYELHIAPEVNDCLIPKLVFLPFVENACIHGIEQLKQGGHIELHIGIEDDYVCFSITDNGKGMQPHQVERILRYLDEEAEIGERIGVQNVIYRLKMIYGDRFSFSLNSQLDQGTAVTIRIPMEKAEPPLKISEVNA
ncbi:Sensor histidine kinase YpdA [compost metagenome]